VAVPLSHDALRAYLQAMHDRPFTGWDFAAFAQGRKTIRVHDTWDYTSVVSGAMQGAQAVLDMDTGGGEAFSTFGPFPPLACATEGYMPNVSLADARLASLGVHVVAALVNRTMPFAAGTFDLITNRHGAYDVRDVWRVLLPGGTFITQQVGSKTNRRLHELLGDDTPEGDWHLAKAARELEAVGWEIMTQREEVFTTRYSDIGAVVYYLKAIPWEVPDFSVDRYFNRLVTMRDLIARDGYLDVPFHSFLIVARKPR